MYGRAEITRSASEGAWKKSDYVDVTHRHRLRAERGERWSENKMVSKWVGSSLYLIRHIALDGMSIRNGSSSITKHILTRWILDESQPSWCAPECWIMSFLKTGKSWIDLFFSCSMYVCASPASTESWWCHYVGILSLSLSLLYVWMADRFDYWKTSVRK